MAKQAGSLFIEGTIDDLSFYKMGGMYYVRLKSCLTSKRFWSEAAFEGSRKSCHRFASGNRLASRVFQLVNAQKRTNGLFPFLRTKAIALLKKGRPAEDVSFLLLDYLIDFGFIEKSTTGSEAQGCTIDNKKARNPKVSRIVIEAFSSSCWSDDVVVNSISVFPFNTS